MIKFEKVVYVSHPYGGKKKNLKAISETLREVQAEHPTFLFLSPVNMFSCLYSDMPYKEGLDRCLWLLDRSDEMWVFGDEITAGMKGEINFCQNLNIKMRRIKETEILKKIGGIQSEEKTT